MYIPSILPTCMIFYNYDDRFIFPVFILLVTTYLLMIFYPKMPSEFRCPNCQSNEYIDYGELIELGTPKELMEKFEAKNLEEVFIKITGRRLLEGM